MSDSSRAGGSHPGRGRRILVVDDDEVDRNAVADLLELAGFRTQVACDGREALNWVLDNPPPAAVVLDLVMPVMDGWAFYAQLRSHARLQHVPVVVLSAAGSGGPPGGVQAFLTKPIHGGLLLRAVSEVTSGS